MHFPRRTKFGAKAISQINSLELQLQFAKRDVESSNEAQARLEKERDAVLDQQQQGDAEIQLMSQKLEALVGLITTRDNDELRTSRREKDKAVTLEREAAAAKRRIAELESRANALERAEAASKKSLEYAQQQAQDAEETARRLADDLARLDEADKARDAELVQLRAKVDSHSAAEVSHPVNIALS
jgi:chromosome segregation ATPase